MTRYTPGEAGGGQDTRRKHPAGQRPQTAVTMRVTQLPPSGRRTCWWALGRCPVCGTPHLSRARSVDRVTRTRRLPCRHWVTVVVARSLSPFSGRGAAA